MIKKILLCTGIVLTGMQNIYAIDWGTTKPIIDTLLLHYQNTPNYQSVITDEWIRTNGTTESVGDTIFAYKFNEFGYMKNGKKTQVFTDHFDVYIDNTNKTIMVQEVTEDAIQKIEKLMPTMETAVKAFEMCDSARLISSVAGVKTLEFYINNPLINKSRVVIDANGWIKEIWRYYTHPVDYISQHTKFVVMDALTTGNIPQLIESNYIKKIDNTIVPQGEYADYALSLLKL